MTITRQLVRLLRDGLAVNLPAATRAQVRLHIADTVGIILAAVNGPPVGHQTVAALSDGADGGACSILGDTRRLPPALAAGANSALAHALDFDDIHDHARLHLTPVTLPAALAAAELAHASFGKVIEAVALGNELMCRLGCMWSPSGKGPGADWHLTQLFGVFGAALSASTVLELTEDQTLSALGLAYMQASGGKQAAFGVGATARSIYPAFAAMSGVTAALMARAGIVGPAESLEGVVGLFGLYMGVQPTCEQLDVLLEPNEWRFVATETKAWPSCRLSHPYVSAALGLRERIEVDPGQVSRLLIAVNTSAGKLCEPLRERLKPETLQDAKYSIPFMTAFTLVNGAPTLLNLDDSTIRDPHVLALAQRIEIEHSLPDGPGHPPARVCAVIQDRSIDVQGKLDFRMSADEIRAKFMACVQFSGRRMDAAALWERIVQGPEAAQVDQVFGSRQAE